MDLCGTNKILNQNFCFPLVINPDQIILVLGSVWIYSGQIWIMLGQVSLAWDRYGFILDQYGLCWAR
jgi:hypothetical protein